MLLMVMMVMTINSQADWKDTTVKVGTAVVAIGIVAAAPVTTPVAATVAVVTGAGTVAGTVWNMTTNKACKRETFYNRHTGKCSLAKAFE